MELANRSSIYKRSESLTFTAPLATLPEVSFPDPKITPHTLYRVPSCHLPTLLTPQILGFSPLSKKFLKFFSPRAPGTVRRVLNRRAAPSHHPKTPEFRGKTAHSRLAGALKSPAKHPSRAPKNPPLTQTREKKLSKVRSTLLTRPPRGCILEYMRLKEPRRPSHTGRHAQHQPPPKLSN